MMLKAPLHGDDIPLNKFEFVRREIETKARAIQPRPRLLDVGCRNCELRAYVAEFADYEGVDLYQNAAGSVAHVLDVSKGLPFEDSNFDYVVALDLIEHLDDFEGALEDLLRITKRSLLVMLPNLAHLQLRLRFLRTGRLSGKYDLIYGQGQDRHRWVTTLTQSDEYMRRFALDRQLDFNVRWFNDSRKKELLAKLGRTVGLAPDLWVLASLYVLTRLDRT
jgi:SAM-dependent methyltransferase